MALLVHDNVDKLLKLVVLFSMLIFFCVFLLLTIFFLVVPF